MFRFLLCYAVLLVPFASTVDAEEPIDFAKQIQPILVEHCAKCHGEKKAAKKLRLDTAEAIQAFPEASLLVKGEPEKSELFERITLPAGDKKLMPKGGDPLPKEQIELIRQWIAEGASFTSAEKPAAPAAEKPAAEKPAAEKPAAEKQGKPPAVQPIPSDAEELKAVKAASQEAIEKIAATGASVMPLAGKSPLLQVSFAQSAGSATDAALATLPVAAEQIVWLNLAGSQATDAGYAALAKLPNVSQLHLEKSAITDAGLAHLSHLKRLTYLNLYGTQITDAGLIQLVNLKRLRKLYLWETKVSYGGAMALQAAIPGLEVNLGWNHPVVARKRIEKQLATAKQNAADAQKKAAAAQEKVAAAEKAAADAKASQERADKRLQEAAAQLKALDAPPAEKKPAGEKPAGETKA